LKLLVLFIANFYFTPDYVNFFGENYTLAIKGIDRDATLIAQASAGYGIDPLVVKSIVFPEYIRNNELGAFMEETGLDLLYVDMGNEAVDFSIGTFQVKPSFASKIEKLIESDKLLSKKYPVLILKGNEMQQRAMRVDRLKSTLWQTRYVCAFIDYSINFYRLHEMDKVEKIKFLSTAYNAGLKKTRAEVEANYGLRLFPYGTKYEIDQVSYWGVSVDYYEKNKVMQ
jgi:hypothetical protein